MMINLHINDNNKLNTTTTSTTV